MSSAKTKPSPDSPLERACRELERRLLQAEPCSAKQMLRESPELVGNMESALELIYTEFVVRQELGQNPSPFTWISDFPEWQSDLRELFQVHDLIGSDVESTLRPGEQAPGSADDTRGEWPMPRGRRIGQYEILEQIGRGGMGVVYKARQIGLGRIVALKMILSAHAGMRERARFHTEAEAAARLQHPNIVQIHEVGQHDGCPFLSMEFIEGGSLAGYLARSPLSVRSACEMVERLAQAMHYAHECGVVHRDLKPANVLLECGGSTPLWIADGKSAERIRRGVEPGRSGAEEIQSGVEPPHSKALCPKITDFGLAKWLRGGDGRDTDGRRDGLTQTGSVLGTPSYMAPEQAEGHGDQIGPATDVYALGAMLYEMLTGRPPFRGETALETLEQIRSHEPVSLRRLLPSLPRDLETICLKCLEKDPPKRYASGQALADDLRRYLDGKPIRARPVAMWERAAKWARRRPAIAALLAILAFVTAVAFAGITWQWLRAETSLVAEVAARNRAERARQAEEEQRNRFETLLYLHDIALAHHEFLTENADRTRQLLDGCREDLRHWEWRYLKRLCESDLMTLRGHSTHVLRVVFSPDGKLIASGSGWAGVGQAGEVKVWDAGTGRERLTFGGLPIAFRDLAFSHDSRMLAATGPVLSGRSGVVKLWDTSTGAEIRTFTHTNNVLCVALSPDGRLLALGGGDGPVMLYHPLTGEQVLTLAGHTDNVFSLAFNPDGKLLASGSRDGSARVWDTASGQQMLRFDHLSDVRSVSFSPDGSRLAAATFDKTLKIWDVNKNEEVLTHRLRAGRRVVYSPDGQTLALSNTDGGMYLWNSTTTEEVRHIRGHTGMVQDVAFSPDGRRLATCDEDRTVKIWDLTQPPEPRTYLAFPQLRAHISSMAFSPDGQLLAMAGGLNTARRDLRDMTLRVWDLSRGRESRVFQGHTGWLTSVAYSPDGQRLATGSEDKTVRVWDATTAQVIFTLQGHSGAVTSVAFSADGNRLLSGSADRTLKVWDLSTGEAISTFSGHTGRVTAAAYAAGGRHIVSAGADKVVRIWDATTQREVQTLGSHAGAVTALALSRDGTRVASADENGVIHTWDWSSSLGGNQSPQPLHTLRGHRGPITGLAFSPEAGAPARLASASWDWTVKVWDASTGQEAITFRTQTRTTSRVAFSPDGQRLVLSLGASFMIWDAEPKQSATTEQAE